MTVREALADHLAELSRALQAQTAPESVLQRVVEAAVVEVPGAESAGVTVVSKREASTPACTDDLVARVDAGQYAANEGPCLDASTQYPIVRSDDLATDTRWPVFAPRAVGFGVRSMISFSMFVQDGAVGALNLYASPPGAFGPDAEQVGTLLAAHAAVATAHKRTEAQLRVAIDSRDVIGQAKGILMERYGITAEQAFDRLIAASQTANMKLRDVAEKLTNPGALGPDM